MPRLDRPNQRLTGVHRGPPRRGPHHLPGLVVLGRLVRPRVRQHGGGVVGSRERERVEGRGHRGTNSTTGHRQSRGVGSPLWTRDSGPAGVDRKWVPALAAGFETVARQRCRRLPAAPIPGLARRLQPARPARPARPVSRQARPAVGERVPSLRRFRDGRSATSSTIGGAPGDRSQPPAATRQPARLWPSPGLSTRPRPSEGTMLDSPGEGQTLGCRVADVPKPASRAGPSAGCGGLDKLDQRWASGCLRCGGFETVAARPPQPAVGQSQRNHGQTAARPPAATR